MQEKKFIETMTIINEVIDGPWVFKNSRAFYSPYCYLEQIDGKIVLVRILRTKNNKRKIKRHIVAYVNYDDDVKKKNVLKNFVKQKEIKQRAEYVDYLLSSHTEISQFFLNKIFYASYCFQKNISFIENNYKKVAYPKDFIEIADILNEYIFQDADYFFLKNPFTHIFDFRMRVNCFYISPTKFIRIQNLSNHEKIIAQEKLFDLVSTRK